jgi:hypothetical protein
LAAERLASAGRAVVLLLAWEKPCGGGVTPKALLRYPFLAGANLDRNWVDGCELISPAGRRVFFPLRQKIAIFSRHALNSLMLERIVQFVAEVFSFANSLPIFLPEPAPISACANNAKGAPAQETLSRTAEPLRTPGGYTLSDHGFPSNAIARLLVSCLLSA